jgi:cyclopropane fatty-acyl-phospholipid synthase-like methyltransferase
MLTDKLFVKAFREDAKYYQTEKEVKAIISLGLKQESTLVDIGAGIGRLSIPLSKYFRVTAIDSDRRLMKEMHNHRIDKEARDILKYFPLKKFDHALLAWPNFSNETVAKKIFLHIKKSILKFNGKLILIVAITDEDNSEKNKSPKLVDLYEGWLKKGYIKDREVSTETGYEYNNFQSAYHSSKFRNEVFRKKKLSRVELKKLRDNIISNSASNGKIFIPVTVKVLSYKVRR